MCICNRDMHAVQARPPAGRRSYPESLVIWILGCGRVILNDAETNRIQHKCTFNEQIFTETFEHLVYPFTTISNKNNECNYMHQEASGLHFCSWLKVSFSLCHIVQNLSVYLISFNFNRQNDTNFFFFNILIHDLTKLFSWDEAKIIWCKNVVIN